MFGYLKFYKELGGTYYNRFKKNYCYLCRSLQNKYGFASRFTLSFDITFFLLSISEENYLSKLNKVSCVNKLDDDYSNYVYTDKIAALNLLLACAKIEDDILDENSMVAKSVKTLLNGAFVKAKNNHPNLWNIIDQGYKEVRRLEKENAAIEKLEEAFASIVTRSAKEEFNCRDPNRLMILDFTSRWLYFIDAFHDYDEDKKENRFNPLDFSDLNYGQRYSYFYNHMEYLNTYIREAELVKDENYKIAYIIATDVVPLTNYRILKEKRWL